MTSSSSPGISLKQEGISYIAGAQLPAVIVNVMRGGPGLGNIWPAQSDYFQATRGGGHGDYHSIVLAPSTVQEAYDCMPAAFDLADRYRMPAIILSDGMLGQMMEPVCVMRPASCVMRQGAQTKKWALTGCKGRRPNVVKSFYLREGELEQADLVLKKKYEAIEDKEQRYEGYCLDDAELVLVAYGTMARIAKGALSSLRAKGRKIGLLRPITLWPFPAKIFKRITQSCAQHRTKQKLTARGSFYFDAQRTTFLVIEMSFGQMLEDVRLAVGNSSVVEFLGRTGGGMPSEEEIIKRVIELLGH
jgi:2-oxoglutarate ferredoxin oxidoreductase subunit alpha